YVPRGVFAPTVIAIVEVPPPGAGMGLGLKLTVVPGGGCELDKLIALLKIPSSVVLIVVLPAVPCCTVTVGGSAASTKSVAVTVRLTVVLCWTPPPFPVTVMG